MDNVSGYEDIDDATSRLLKLAELSMSEDGAGQKQPAYVGVERRARPALMSFQEGILGEAEKAQGLKRSTLGKAARQVLRVALGLEYLWWCGNEDRQRPEPQEISCEAIEAAVKLIWNYCLPMAERVMGDAYVPMDRRDARTLAQ